MPLNFMLSQRTFLKIRLSATMKMTYKRPDVNMRPQMIVASVPSRKSPETSRKIACVRFITRVGSKMVVELIPLLKRLLLARAVDPEALILWLTDRNVIIHYVVCEFLGRRKIMTAIIP